MDPLGRLLSISFCHITNHLKTWWFKATTLYLAFDSVDWQMGWAQLLLWVGSWSQRDPSCVCGSPRAG